MSSIHNVAHHTLVWVLLAFLMTRSMRDILELDLQTKWQTVEEELMFRPQKLWQTYTVYLRDKATKLFSVAYISCENCINNIFFIFLYLNNKYVLLYWFNRFFALFISPSLSPSLSTASNLAFVSAFFKK